MSRKPQIFLSYAREDLDRVKKVYSALTEAGFDAWLDVARLLPGQNWKQEIHKAIKQSDLVIIFLSHVSVAKRGFLQRELKESLKLQEEKLETDIYVVPVRLDDCKVPESLSRLHWVDVFTNEGWDRLLAAIKVSLSQTAVTNLTETGKRLEPNIAGKHRSLRINSPEDGAQVGSRIIVNGHIDDKRAEIWVIVRPVMSSSFWVQPRVSVHDNGYWQVGTYIGGSGSRDAGEHFEIVAVGNSRMKLNEGMVLDQWPSADHTSQVITVTRSADAKSDGTASEPRVDSRRNVSIGSSDRTVIVTGDGNTVNNRENVQSRIRRKPR